VNQSGDPLQMVVAAAKLASGSSFTLKIPHLEGEEYLDLLNKSKIYPMDQKVTHIGTIMLISLVCKSNPLFATLHPMEM
jgi:hypothetical protein